MKTWIPDARNFAYLNWKQVEALPRESTLLVLPTAAIEQHGHHLPLATDTLINNLLLGKALSKLPVPVSDTVAGVAEALLVIETLPVALPAVVGAYVTVNCLLAPALTDVGAVRLVVKPEPEIVAAVMVRAALPLFVTVTV